MISHKSELLTLPTQELLVRRHQWAAHLGDVERVLLGSLVEQTRRCGKDGCRCATGSPHGPYAFLTPRRDGRGMRYVPAAQLVPTRSCLQQGDLVEAALTEISSINVELLARRALR